MSYFSNWKDVQALRSRLRISEEEDVVEEGGCLDDDLLGCEVGCSPGKRSSFSRLGAGDFGDPRGGRGIVSRREKVSGKDRHYLGQQRFISGRVPFLGRRLSKKTTTRSRVRRDPACHARRPSWETSRPVPNRAFSFALVSENSIH